MNENKIRGKDLYKTTKENDLYFTLKRLLVENRYSETLMAEKIGFSQVNLNTKLKKGTLRYLEVEKILDVLGYEIVWQKKE